MVRITHPDNSHNMTIKESFQAAKSPQTTTEDGIAVTNNFAAVVDGSTSKGTLLLGGKSSGRVAMEIVCESIQHLDANITSAEAANKLTNDIRQLYIENDLLENAIAKAENRFTCSAVIFSKRRREIWFIGDCQCRFGGQTYTNEKLVDRILADIRCDAIEYLLRHGHTIEDLQLKDLGRAFILDALKDQCNFQNSKGDNPFLYAVIDGFPIDEGMIKTIHVPPHIHEVVLASDGYPVVCDTLDATEKELQRLLRTDLLCYSENRCTKGVMAGADSYDDRTFLRIEI